jgi:AcrR family transcriptional regulator
VDAILEATLQVLVGVGKERLTTTLVAHRAGVSVGTLYQYFPNKSSLLQACLRQHMGNVLMAMEHVAVECRGQSIFDMASALIHAYLQAKLRDIGVSTGLYAIAYDLDGIAIAKDVADRIHRCVTDLFAGTMSPLNKDPELVTTVVLAAVNGVTRKLLEEPAPEEKVPLYREELLTLVRTYLETCTA